MKSLYDKSTYVLVRGSKTVPMMNVPSMCVPFHHPRRSVMISVDRSDVRDA